MIVSDAQLESLGWSRGTVRLYGPLTRWFLALAMVLCLAVQGRSYARIAEQTVTLRHMQDFGLFYAQARRAVIEGANPYEGTVRLPGASSPVRGANLNPPHFLLIVAPLAWLDPMTAFVAWAALSVVSALAALRIMFREAGLRVTPTVGLWTATVLLAAAPTGALLMAWQVSWLVWGPLTWAWAQARRGHWTASAVGLGVLLGVKPFLGLFLITLAADRRWRALGAAGATAAAGFAAGLIGIGWDAHMSWIRTLGGVTWMPFVFNASLLGFTERLLVLRPMPVWDLAPVMVAPALARPLWLLASAGVIGVSARAVWRERDAMKADRMFAVTLGASLLVSPLGWIYYEFLLAGPVLALCVRERWWTGPRWRRVLLACSAVSLVLGPGFLTAGQPSGWATLTLGSFYFWGLLALWAQTAAVPAGRAGRRELLDTSEPPG